MTNGFFITFEGGEGCGKTTQAKMLVDRLQSKYDIVYAREPGTTKIGEGMRKLALVDEAWRSPEIDLLLFETARRPFVEEIVKPNLDLGKIVIADRFFDSTTAYQGYGCGVYLETIDYFNKFASCGIDPNLTFIIDIDAKQGLEKTLSHDTKGRQDNITSRGLEFHERVNKGYREIAKQNPERCVIIPYNYGGVMSMHGRIYNITLDRLSKVLG